MPANRSWIAAAAIAIAAILAVAAVQAVAGESEFDQADEHTVTAADIDEDSPADSADAPAVADEDAPDGEEAGDVDDEEADAEQPEPEQLYSEEELEAGREAFEGVHEVLVSPRCANCHPTGDQPLQGDEGTPHAFGISRDSIEAGLECATCHREQNSEAWGVEGGPPGSPHWAFPPEDMPMVFEGRTPRELCEQLKDPERSGHDNLEEFLEHLEHDPLVLWGWEPGGDRSTPPLSHEELLEHAETWAEVGGPCPE